MKFLFLALAIMTSISTNASADGKVWATAISKQAATDRAIVFRYIRDFQPGFSRQAYPERIIIVWRYQSPSGMPEKADNDRMSQLEDLLTPVVEKPGFSSLVLVSTGENLREWVYYAKSEKEFLASLNKALAGHRPFPIEIHGAKDPEWSTYEQFRNGVRE